MPTAYGRWFPRLLNCPENQFFNPDHVDGCLGPDGTPGTLPKAPTPQFSPSAVDFNSLEAQPSVALVTSTLPPPVFGQPSPLITHIGTPLPLGASSGFSNVAKRSFAIEISEDGESDDYSADGR